MSDETPTYLVNPDNDPVLISIQGRASFQNSGNLNKFLLAQLASGKRNFAIDFQHCTTMDSTFLGVLAGIALDLRKQTPPGTLVLCRLAERNHELIENLGLHRLLILDTTIRQAAAATKPLAPDEAKTEAEHARHVLAAHENLIAADKDNLAKFKDVLEILKQQIADDIQGLS